jgi:hypothetical protein
MKSTENPSAGNEIDKPKGRQREALEKVTRHFLFYWHSEWVQRK